MIRLVRVLSATLLVAAAGCAGQPQGTVVPLRDGTFRLIETGKTEREALQTAQRDAELTCKKHAGSRSWVAVDHGSEDVGLRLDQDGGTVRKLATRVIEHVARSESGDNYRVEMVIECRPPAG